MSSYLRIGLGWLILLVSVTYWPYWFGRQQAREDHIKIILDGVKDSLKEQFHTNNAIFRAIALVLVAAVQWVFLFHCFGFGVVWFLAYLLYSVAAFGYAFTTNLNEKRGLPKWYVSHSPRASKTDKFLIKGSAAMGMQPQSFSRLLHTNFLYFSGVILLLSVVYELFYA
jgi:fatty acid desaturase